MDSLQLTLIVALIVLSLLTVASFLRTFYLESHNNKKEVAKIYQVHVDAKEIIPHIDTTEIEKQTQAELLKSSQDGAEKMQTAINGAVSRIAEHVEQLTNTTLNAEFQKYQLSLQALREQSITEFTKLQQELNGQRDQMIQNLDKQVAAEYSKRLDQLNAKIDDVVSSYVIESLGTDVDLSEQLKVVLKNLDKHKQDIKKDILA